MAFHNIFTDGILIDIDVSKWTAEKALQAEDLGIRKEQLPKTFRLGHKALIPMEKISEFCHLDYMVRKHLTDHSFPFAFGNARFVPKKRFMDFMEGFEKIKSSFEAAVKDLCDNYESYKLKVRPDYVKAAHEAYSRMKKFNKDFDEDKDKFINSFLERVDSFYPPAEDIRGKFSMIAVPHQMAMPDLSQATVDDVVSDSNKAELIKSTYQSALYDKIQSYVDDIVGDLRTRAEKVLSILRNNIKQGKRITTASLNTIKKLVEEYENMNIIGDNKFYNELVSFRTRRIDPFTAKQVMASKKLQKEIVEELNGLLSKACNNAEIAAVADAYKKKIQL